MSVRIKKEVPAERAVLEGGTEALSDFVTRLTGNEYVFALPVFFLHLKKSKIPSPAEFDSIISNPKRALDLGPIMGAGLCLNELYGMILLSRIPAGAYTDLWPSLYPWMIFTDVYWEYLPRQFQVISPKDICAASSGIILAFGDHTDTSHLVRTAPRIRAVLVKYWRALADNDGLIAWHEGMDPQTDGWVHLYRIVTFLCEDEVKSASRLEELADGVDGSKYELALLFLQQLRGAATHCNSRPGVGAMTLTVIMALITARDGDSPQFKETLLSLGLVPNLIRALRAMDDYTRYNDPEDIGPGIAIGFGLLVSRFQCVSGEHWLAQAIESGLLDLIIRLGISTRPVPAFDPRSTFPLLKQMLQNVLPGYFVYYPVTLAMKNHYPPIRSAAATPAFKRCAISDLWAEFTKFAEQDITAFDFFKSKTRRPAKACENMECLRIAEKSQFRRCSGCGRAYYCSVKCQKVDWTCGHKNWCRKLASMHFPGPCTARDRAFLAAFMQHTLTSTLKIELMLYQLEFIYTNPGMDFFTAFNFIQRTDGPGSGWITVSPISEYNSAEAPYRIAQLARSGRRMQLHSVRMNGGPTPFVRMLPLWSSSSLVRDGLVRVAKSLPAGREFSEISNDAVPGLVELQREYERAGVVEIY
ncbi:hypothetical protein DFH06DRAFT_1317786 [Mycena polygramma]|nr:hypothetical protein DFH06DRAFT_1317786 [Mycena polygramma]